MALETESPGRGERPDGLVGSTVGNYRVLERIGQGGMGVVYLAHHGVLGRRAALKVLLPEFSNNQELVGRFFNEARATAQLRHRGFVEVFDSGHLPDGSAYLVMEYLSGANLGKCIEHRGTLPLPESLTILRDVAAAVEFAHSHNIVHRDLKPDNIYIATDREDAGAGERVTVKVLDFGIAKLSTTANADGHQSARTRTGLLLGTPLFMSPEQCRGAGSVDHRSDIYSLGCIAYNMLTGAPPFLYEGFGEIIAAHLNQSPAAMRARVPSLPPAIERLVLGMQAKAPADRPQTMAEVSGALEGFRRTLPAQPWVGLQALVPNSSAPDPLAARQSMPGADFLSATGASAPNIQVAAAGRGRGPTISTLGGMASAIEPLTSTMGGQRGSRRTLVAVGGLAGLVAVVGTALYLRSGTPSVLPAPPAQVQAPSPRPAEPPRPAEAPRPVDVPVPAPPKVPRAAPVPPTVAVTITSVPPGASVFDASTGKTLGATPFSSALPRTDGSLRVEVRKRGYRSKEMSIDMSHDTQTAVTLDKRPGAERRAPDEDRRKL